MAGKKVIDDDDAESSAADRAAVENMKTKVAESSELSASDRPDEATEVDVDEAEDELGARPDASSEMRESRNERRRNRYREAQEEAAMARREADDLRRQNQQFMEMLQRQQAPQAPQGPPPKSEVEELEGRWNDIARQQDLLYRDYNSRKQVTPQEQEEFARKSRELQMQMTVTGGEIALRRAGVQKPPDERQIRATIQAERLHSEHGDIVGDERKRMYADGEWRKLIAWGKPNDWSTICEAMERTRQAYGLPLKSRQAPSESYKRKLAGSARGAGASTGSESRNTVVMGKAEKRMANAMYSHISDEGERYKRWAASAGKKILDSSKTG